MKKVFGGLASLGCLTLIVVFLFYIFSTYTGKVFIASVLSGLLGLIILIGIFFLLTYFQEVASNYNDKKLKSLADRDPELYQRLQGELDDDEAFSSWFFFSNWFLQIVILLLFILNVNRPFLAITIFQTLVILGFYVSMLRSLKDLGRWSFYQVRVFALPYFVLLFPVMVGGSLINFSLIIAIREIHEYFGVLQALDDYWLNWVFEHIPPWKELMIQLIRYLTWSFGISFIIVWTMPILMRKDYLSIILTLLAIFSPIITDAVTDQLQSINIPLNKLLNIPLPVLSLILMLSVGAIYDWLRGKIKERVKCLNCGEPIPASNNFCGSCGHKNPEINRH